MHQTKKGNQWYFGMKAHFGVDSRTKLIHAVTATPANVADSMVLAEWSGSMRPRPRISPTAATVTARLWMRSSGEKPHQVQSAGPRRTCDRGHQADVRLCQGALSRTKEEYA
jgi:Transposase DDE domain